MDAEKTAFEIFILKYRVQTLEELLLWALEELRQIRIRDSLKD